MSTEAGQRITLKRVRPNPLFEEWLEELYEEAKAKKSKLESMLKEALDSLSKYPLPLNSGAECAILKGFEKKLCLHLDMRLEVHKHNLAQSDSLSSCSSDSNSKTTNIPMSNRNRNVDTENIETENVISKPVTLSRCNTETNSNIDLQDIMSVASSQSSLDNVNGKKPKGKKYKPAHGSGGYAILIALLEHSTENPNETPLTKEEVIEKAQKHSDESFIRPKPDSFYTAWSNMARLVTKGLVKKVSVKRKVKYQLTEEGKVLAKEILEETKDIPTVNDIIFNDATSESNIQSSNLNVESIPSSNTNNTVIELEGGSFDIILLIDKNETGGVSKKTDPTVAQFNKYPDLNHEYRSLKVGDFTWIARHREKKDQELVLPYIVERKRMDDLGASIKDGRFHEQKFRLRKCGLKNVLYLVEHYGGNKHVGLPLQSLKQSLANTRVQDGFKVHFTDSLKNSARFLAMMTKRLVIRYKDKNLKGWNEESNNENLMTFEYFNKSSAKTKTLTVTETFIKLLLQLKGVSVEKALAITEKYKTPRSLIIAYQKCDQYEGELLLANLKYGGLARNVGPAVSKSIYQLFTSVGSE